MVRARGAEDRQGIDNMAGWAMRWHLKRGGMAGQPGSPPRTVCVGHTVWPHAFKTTWQTT